MNRFRERIGFGPPVVFAHRGDSFHAPENTLAAAHAAHASGAFAWELDVHLSRDGVPVVIHDESLVRTTDVATRFAGDARAAGGFRVADFDWVEIRSLDAGSWFVDPAAGHRTSTAFGTLGRLSSDQIREFTSGQVRVPSLLEALELTRDLDWLVNVELKTFPDRDPRSLIRVLEVIDQSETSDRVLISSFDHEEVARAVRSRPAIPTGALSETPLASANRYVREIIGADFYHVSAASLGCESRHYRGNPGVESLRAIEDTDAACPVLVYTVNDSANDGIANHLRAAGVAGVFTDDPISLLRLWSDSRTKR